MYAKALFGLALEKQGQKEKLDMILQNIAQFLQQDEEDQTAYLKLPETVRGRVFERILKVLPERVTLVSDLTLHLARLAPGA